MKARHIKTRTVLRQGKARSPWMHWRLAPWRPAKDCKATVKRWAMLYWQQATRKESA
jgi:hypothetical protein